MREKDSLLQSNGLLLCVCGPSGAGKGTLISGLLENIPNLFLSISQTTREPRLGEKHGEHYYFCSREEFERQLEAGEILEYDEYLDNYYGTPAPPIREQLASGKNVVLDITIAGGFRVKELFPEAAVLVFVIPENLEVLRNRLTGRGTEPAHIIEQRLQQAVQELDNVEKFDYLLINDVLENSLARFRSILLAESCKVRRQKQAISELKVDFAQMEQRATQNLSE